MPRLNEVRDTFNRSLSPDERIAIVDDISDRNGLRFRRLRHVPTRPGGKPWEIVAWPGYLLVDWQFGHLLFGGGMGDLLTNMFHGQVEPQRWLRHCRNEPSDLRTVSELAVRKMADEAKNSPSAGTDTDGWNKAVYAAHVHDNTSQYESVLEALGTLGVFPGIAQISDYSRNTLMSLLAIEFTRREYCRATEAAA